MTKTSTAQVKAVALNGSREKKQMRNSGDGVQSLVQRPTHWQEQRHDYGVTAESNRSMSHILQNIALATGSTANTETHAILRSVSISEKGRQS